jgi:hypothetical protein
LAVKYGTKVIEPAKGKHSVEGLVKVLTTIKSAVDAGELNTQIAIANVNLRKGFSK